MDTVFKLAALCVASGLFAQLLKKDTPSFALLLSIAATTVLAVELLDRLKLFWDELQIYRSFLPQENTQILLAVLEIALVTQLAVDFCKESGLLAAATVAELLGKVLALAQALPLFGELLNLFSAFLS